MAAPIIARPTNWQHAARHLARRLPHGAEVGQRLAAAARLLVGRPYVAEPLVGGVELPERLVIDLEGFDCVTLVETVLALARSSSPTAFRRELIATRYRDGKVAWPSRLHYFSEWMKRNHQRGAIRIRTGGAGARPLDKELDRVRGLRARRARFDVVPRRGLARARARIDHGAIVAFASLSARLDFFHTGLLLSEPEGLTLVHASRSRGAVIAEPLAEFFGRNRTRGIAFASPREAAGRQRPGASR